MPKTRVLVVDDEESMRYFLTRALKRKGFDVAEAVSGEEALEDLAANDRDVILLDLKLPRMDGIEVLKRAKELRPAAAVIMMSGYGTVDRALEAMRYGASDFVAKPLAIEEVLEKIDEARVKLSPRPVRDDAPPPRPSSSAPLPPPRPLSAFLLEAAELRGLDLTSAEGGDLAYREAARIFETLYFTDLIERTGGNVSLAARIAGISRPSLHRKIQDLAIDVDRFR
ncbi:MAG: response regulator [Planctomycetota bacterium]